MVLIYPINKKILCFCETMNLKTYISLKRGTTKVMADELGVTYQAIRDWANKRVPAERVFDVYRATKGRVTPTDMRPDIYPSGLVTINFKIESSGV